MTAATTLTPTLEGSPSAKYDRVTIALHWVVAATVAFQWLGAHTIDWFPKGPLRVDARSVHIVVGTTLAVAVLFRIGWRLNAGERLPLPGSSPARYAAMLVHKTLYVALLLTLGLGAYNSWMRGDSIFGLFRLPYFGSYTAAVRHTLANEIVGWHRTAANAILIVAGAHAVAALAHYFILKDSILQRMLPAWNRIK